METEKLFLTLLTEDQPDAVAVLRGNEKDSDLSGIVKFFA